MTEGYGKELALASYLQAACARKWKRRMGFGRRIAVAKDALVEARKMGLLARWSSRTIWPGKEFTFVGERHRALPHGGLAVTAYAPSVGFFRTLVVFR